MTPGDFKAWFDGFTEALGGTPTKAQWARIKERVGEIDGTPVTERVYVDRYLPPLRPYYQTYPTWHYMSGTAGGISALQAVGQSIHNTAGFNSANAMYALGKTDLATLS